MHESFQQYVESMHPSFERLLAMEPAECICQPGQAFEGWIAQRALEFRCRAQHLEHEPGRWVPLVGIETGQGPAKTWEFCQANSTAITSLICRSS